MNRIVPTMTRTTHLTRIDAVEAALFALAIGAAGLAVLYTLINSLTTGLPLSLADFSAALLADHYL